MIVGSCEMICWGGGDDLQTMEDELDMMEDDLGRMEDDLQTVKIRPFLYINKGSRINLMFVNYKGKMLDDVSMLEDDLQPSEDDLQTIEDDKLKYIHPNLDKNEKNALQDLIVLQKIGRNQGHFSVTSKQSRKRIICHQKHFQHP